MRLFRHVLVVLASSIVALPPSEAAEQTLQPACSLLTTGEVEAALGLPLTPPANYDTQVPSGPAQGQTIRMCLWPRGTQNHAVTLSVSPAMAPLIPNALQPQSQQYYDMFQKQGYTLDKQTFDNGMCLAVAPSATARAKAFVTNCTLQAKGMQLHVMASSTTNAVPPESVKKLVDLAITRLR